jgi:hypothetical protein
VQPYPKKLFFSSLPPQLHANAGAAVPEEHRRFLPLEIRSGHTHTYIHIHTYTHIHIHTYTHTDTHTHTHTHARRSDAGATDSPPSLSLTGKTTWYVLMARESLRRDLLICSYVSVCMRVCVLVCILFVCVHVYVQALLGMLVAIL